MSESQCLNADWFLIGEQDGRDGLPRSQLVANRESCGNYGVTPDRDEYEAGRARGLTDYCTDLNGYREGKSGLPYHRVCPADVEPEFLYGYDTGVSVRMAVVRVDRVLGRLEGKFDGLHRERGQVVSQYRRTVDEARRRGFAELYAY